jgi:hypothetical protein
MSPGYNEQKWPSLTVICFLITFKLGKNDHEYNEFKASTNQICFNNWSQIVSLQHFTVITNTYSVLKCSSSVQKKNSLTITYFKILEGSNN